MTQPTPVTSRKPARAARAVRAPRAPRANTTLTNEMAEKYLPRVQRHAARIARKLPRHVNVGDLVSAGCCGLLDAFLKFDPTRMESFDAYVDHRIRGAILDELRAHDPLTRDQRTFAKRAAIARTELQNRTGYVPEEREIAAEMGLTLAQYRHQVDRLHATASRSEASPFNEDEDPLSEPANDAPETLYSSKEDRARIDTAMAQLTARHREVLHLHYDDGRTLREIGIAIGVTESRVSQIHAEALTRLREVLATMEE